MLCAFKGSSWKIDGIGLLIEVGRLDYISPHTAKYAT